jgi:predicted secreted Zn-dependent protease
MKYLVAIISFLMLNQSAFCAEWTPREVVKLYEISGVNGPDLYQSIGDNGPLIGTVRTIAHTNWDIKWSRTYVPDGSACLLQSAKPFVTITYTLPKPQSKLTGAMAARWTQFSDGIRAHEKVHGADIVQMVNEIISATVGLRHEKDADCKLIRADVLALVKTANETYKTKSRAFDAQEMAAGGPVHKLILSLVNGQ